MKMLRNFAVRLLDILWWHFAQRVELEEESRLHQNYEELSSQDDEYIHTRVHDNLAFRCWDISCCECWVWPLPAARFTLKLCMAAFKGRILQFCESLWKEENSHSWLVRWKSCRRRADDDVCENQYTKHDQHQNAVAHGIARSHKPITDLLPEFGCFLIFIRLPHFKVVKMLENNLHPVKA